MENLLKSIVFDKVGIPKLGNFLNLGAMRHRLIAGNISNVLTPDYKTKDIDFYEEVKNFDSGRHHLTPVATHPNHIPVGREAHGTARIIEDSKSPENGINNVSVDREMAQLSINQINYTVGAQMLERKFSTLRRVIKGQV